jgi:predicted enzyme related to lactoylglutathione lyase
VPCWIDTTQPDPEAATAFYGGLFGWEFEDRMPPGADGHYFVATMRGLDVAAVGSAPDAGPPGATWNTYIWVDSVDDAALAVKEAGGATVMEPFDVGEAGRMAVFADPAGAVFSVWQAGQHRGAQVVNEPGTWNWSDLNTRDVEGAKEFYGAVFGWQADTVDLGFDEGTMLRRPGYGDVLALDDPDLRQRMVEFGAPPGFEDCIGWILPMTDDRFPPGVPPHWHVTFTVDDADAVAGRAADLGGEVVVPPTDLGVVRVAVLRDPHGATFSVNKFTPPDS